MALKQCFSGLELGDLATWVAAFGTIAAVVVALWLARSDGRRREREKYARARVIASYIFTEVGLLDKRVTEAIRHAEAAKIFFDERAVSEISVVSRLIGSIDAGRFVANLDKFVDLPADHAVFLAAIPDMKWVLLEMSKLEMPLPLPQDAHQIADEVLPQLRVIKDRCADFLAEFLPQFAT